MNEEEARQEIISEIAKVRENGPYSQGMFSYGNGRFGLFTAQYRLVPRGSMFEHVLDQWEVKLFAPSKTHPMVSAWAGKIPVPEKMLSFLGDDALIDWYVKEGPHATQQGRRHDLPAGER